MKKLLRKSWKGWLYQWLRVWLVYSSGHLQPSLQVGWRWQICIHSINVAVFPQNKCRIMTANKSMLHRASYNHCNPQSTIAQWCNLSTVNNRGILTLLCTCVPFNFVPPRYSSFVVIDFVILKISLDLYNIFKQIGGTWVRCSSGTT